MMGERNFWFIKFMLKITQHNEIISLKVNFFYLCVVDIIYFWVSVREDLHLSRREIIHYGDEFISDLYF